MMSTQSMLEASMRYHAPLPSYLISWCKARSSYGKTNYDKHVYRSESHGFYHSHSERER